MRLHLADGDTLGNKSLTGGPLMDTIQTMALMGKGLSTGQELR